MIQIGTTKNSEMCDSCKRIYKNNLTDLKIGKIKTCLCKDCLSALKAIVDQYKEAEK